MDDVIVSYRRFPLMNLFLTLNQSEEAIFFHHESKFDGFTAFIGADHQRNRYAVVCKYAFSTLVYKRVKYCVNDCLASASLILFIAIICTRLRVRARACDCVCERV